jgi:hypothetical protein
VTDELAMLRQFRNSIADISLTVPSGVNGAQWASKKLRELRRTARIYRDQSAPALIDHLESDGGVEAMREHVRDFRWRANQCRTNLDAYDSNAAAIWDLAADALEGK